MWPRSLLHAAVWSSIPPQDVLAGATPRDQGCALVVKDVVGSAESTCWKMVHNTMDVDVSEWGLSGQLGGQCLLRCPCCGADLALGRGRVKDSTPVQGLRTLGHDWGCLAPESDVPRCKAV